METNNQGKKGRKAFEQTARGLAVDWNTVDWTQSDMALGKLFGTSTLTAGKIRRRLGKTPNRRGRRQTKTPTVIDGGTVDHTDTTVTPTVEGQ